MQYKRSSTSPKLTFKKDLNRSAFGSSGDRVDGGAVGKTADHLARSVRSVENLNQFDEKNHLSSAATGSRANNLQKSTSDSGLDELAGTPDQDGSGCIVS